MRPGGQFFASQAVVLAVATVAAILGYWLIAGLAFGSFWLMVVHRLWLRDRRGATSQLAAGAFVGAIAVTLIGIGVYALAFSRLPLAAGFFFLLAALVPASYFMLLAWAISYGAVTGQRLPRADRINAFFARASQPLGKRRT